MAWGFAKWFLKALYLVWFCRVGAELFLRGLMGRPINEIRWGGYTEYERPAIPVGAQAPPAEPARDQAVK